MRAADGPPTDSQDYSRAARSEAFLSRLWSGELSVETIVWLATGAVLLPLLLLIGFGFRQWLADERAEELARVAGHAEALARAVDRELLGSMETANVLAGSRHLQLGDFATMDQIARDAAAKIGGQFAVIDRALKQRINTRSPPGSDLPTTLQREAVAEVFATGQPRVGNLMTGSFSGQLQFVIWVPVEVGGERKYVLAHSPRPHALRDVVDQMWRPAGWYASVMDGAGRIVARSARNDDFFGKPAAPEFLARLTGNKGVVESTDLEGRASVTAYHKSTIGDWRAVVWVPKAVLQAPAESVQYKITGLLIVTMLGSVLVASLVGRVITAPTRRLAASASALGAGGRVVPQRGLMREANIVDHALSEASYQISRREEQLRAEERDRSFQLALSERLLSWKGKPLALVGKVGVDIAAHLGADRAFFNEVHGSSLVPIANRGDLDASGALQDLMRTSPHLMKELSAGRTLVVADCAALVHPGGSAEKGDGPRALRAFIVAPVVRDGSLTATLHVAARRPREWTQREAALVRAVAERAWARLERLRVDERLRIAIDGARLGLFERNLESGAGYWAPSTCDLYGVPPSLESNTEAQWLGLVHPEDRDNVEAALEESRRGKPYRVEYRICSPRHGVRWLAARGEVLRESERRSERLIGVCFDITERMQAEAALRESEERMRLALEAGRMGAWSWRPAAGSIDVDDSTLALFGMSRDQWNGDPAGMVDRILLEDRPAFNAAVDRTLVHGEPYSAEFRVEMPDGTIRWLAGRGRVERDAHGTTVVLRGVTLDITRRKQREQENVLLLREVNHRSKNMLSLVLAVARQTAAATPADFVRRFTERVQALSASQDLLVSSEWKGADVRELVTAQLAHFKDLVGTQIHLEGPRCQLLPSAAQSIGMALHELATNAGKYGALSASEGRIDIAWSTQTAEGGEIFVMSWRESGGPMVKQPEQRGFGSTVVGTLVRMSLQGRIEIDFAPGGLQWRLECPVENAIVMGSST